MAIRARIIRNYFVGDLGLPWVVIRLHTQYGIS